VQQHARHVLHYFDKTDQMKKTSILMLANYPIAEPRHGGQLRTYHINEEYKKAGINVQLMSFFHEGGYQCYRNSDIPLPGTLSVIINKDFDYAVYDYLSALHVAQDPVVYGKLAAQIANGNYDYVQLEQPYFWPVVKKILAAQGRDWKGPRVIYSSQNIEFEMKEEVLRKIKAPQDYIDTITKSIREIEIDLVRNADLTFAVSQQDKIKLQELGQRADIHLLPNGVGKLAVNSQTVDGWRPILPKEPFATYISSAHLPNAVGFFSLFGNSLAFLPPDRKIIVAGGVCTLIERSEEFNRWSSINRSRSILLGSIDDIGVAALRKFTHVFTLPITTGGGSNIKTAEALVSGAYVLSTSMAFRGFEEFADEPGVYIEDDPKKFRSRMVTILNQTPNSISDESRNKREKLLWEHTLKDISKVVAKDFNVS
jgi:glycosyltransferase involved in cell wall biosynthesis